MDASLGYALSQYTTGGLWIFPASAAVAISFIVLFLKKNDVI